MKEFIPLIHKLAKEGKPVEEIVTAVVMQTTWKRMDVDPFVREVLDL